MVRLALTLALVAVATALVGGSRGFLRTPDAGRSAQLAGPTMWASQIAATRPRNLAAANPYPTLTTSYRSQQVRLMEAYDKLPLSFEANQGQADSRVKFLGRGRGYTVFVAPTEALLALRQPSAKEDAKSQTRNSKHEARMANPESRNAAWLHMKLVGANPAAQLSGLTELSGRSNHFIGNDPKRWLSNVPTYAQVRCENVYPAIDLVYYGDHRQLEYDFVISPGADPKAVRLAFDDLGWARHTPRLRIDAQGDLVARMNGGELRFRKPRVYQVRGQGFAPREIEGGFALKGQDEVGFEVAAYDTSQPLIIDPVLSYATYVGGSADDAGYGIVVDSSGNAYVTGSTGSANFPTATPLQGSSGAPVDAFVAKLKADGSGLVYSTYLGGSGFDRSTSIAIDASGNAYVAGYTSSSNFPTTKGALQTTYGRGWADAFVAKLNPQGSSLVYATFLGGSDADYARGIALDASGSAYVTGDTQSADFPTASPFQSAMGGTSDAFVAKLKPDGSGLVYSTYLGGGDADTGQAIALDSSGNAYATGYTFSTNFPTMNPLQAAIGAGSDAFVAQFNAAGSALVYSTYFGGSGMERAFGIAVDASGNAYVTGDTTSTDLPTTPGSLATTYHGNGDAFVAKWNAAGAALVYSSYLGGADADQGSGVVVDSSGNVYLTGSTRSSDFPTVSAALETFGGGTCDLSPCADAFVTELNATGDALIYSTFLGGKGADYGQAVALDSSGNAYVTGVTASANFPATAGAFEAAYGGSGPSGDVFIARVGPANAPGVSLLPQKLSFGDQATGTTSAPQVVTLINSGTAPLNISSIVASSNFNQTNNCEPSVAGGGASCALSITFSPTATGDATGTVTITDDAASSPQTISLAGKGVAPAPAVSLSATKLDFGDQLVGTTSTPQTVTVSNSGTATLTISKVAISGDFSQTEDCTGANLAPGASCAVTVTFKPTSSGSLNGTVSITHNASSTATVVNLVGNAIPAYSLTSNVGSKTLTWGTDSTTFTISAASESGYAESITLSCTGVSSITCTFNPTAIKPGESSTLTLSKLSAITAGTVDFKVSGTSGTAPATQTASVSLTILLGNFSLSATPPLASVKAGESATYTLTVTPINGFKEKIEFGCAFPTLPVPRDVSCSFEPASPTLNGSTATTVTVTVKTKARSLGVGRERRRMIPPGVGGHVGLPWFAWLLALAILTGLAAVRRGRLAWLVRVAPLAAIALSVVLWAGCENYYYDPIAPPTPTPGTLAGTYTISIVGTFTPTTGTPLVQGTSVNLTVS